MAELLIPIAGLAWLAFTVWMIVRLVSTWLLNRTIREAIRNHPEAVPLLVGHLDGSGRGSSELLGWVAIAAAAALLLLGILEIGEDRQGLMGMAIFTGIIGATILAWHYLRRSGAAPDRTG